MLQNGPCARARAGEELAQGWNEEGEGLGELWIWSQGYLRLRCLGGNQVGMSSKELDEWIR